LKDRINGIDFTSQGHEIWLTKIVDEKDENKQYELLEVMVDRLIKKYYERLSDELRTTRNDMVDKLRKELADEYEERLNKAREMVKELQDKIKLLENKNV